MAIKSGNSNSNIDFQSNNSKLKVDCLNENFKFKLTKCKIHFHNWQYKSHNWHSTTANSQLRKHSSQFSVYHGKIRSFIRAFLPTSSPRRVEGPRNEVECTFYPARDPQSISFPTNVTTHFLKKLSIHTLRVSCSLDSVSRKNRKYRLTTRL